MKTRLLLTLVPLTLGMASCGGPSSDPAKEITLTDAIGRELKILPGSYKKVVCIGAGALRLYSYVGDANLLSGVEDIENMNAEGRPAMFDNVARPYVMANKDTYNTLPSCGKGGPQAQAAEAEKILSCKPDIVISEYEDVDKENALQEQLGVPVVTMRYGNGHSDFYNSLEILGKVFGKEDRAKALIDFDKAENKKIEDLTANIPESERKNTYICGLGNWGTTNALMTAQDYRPLNLVHANNIVTGLPKSGIQAIDQEKFESLAPKMDVMIFDAAAVKNIKGKDFDFSSCKAFETGEVYLEMAYNAYFTNAEISLINTWFIGKSLYPSVFADIDIEAKANEITKMFNGKELYGEIKAMKMSYGGYQKIANPTEFFK